MNRDKSRSVPRNAPLEWINQRWRPCVVTDDGIDRRFYELCALTELKNRLRSGDVWVTGSRPSRTSTRIFLNLSASLNCGHNKAYRCRSSKRVTLMWPEGSRYSNSLSMKWTAWPRSELPDAAVSESGLKITPLTNAVPEEASVLMRRAYALLPHIKITDLLLEVDRWTGFSKHFTHLKTGESAKVRREPSCTPHPGCAAMRANRAFLSRPSVAWVLETVTLWIWHIPTLYQATLTSDWIHAAQHLSFFLTAVHSSEIRALSERIQRRPNLADCARHPGDDVAASAAVLDHQLRRSGVPCHGVLLTLVLTLG